MERIKLTNHQFFSLSVNYTCGAAIIVITAGVTNIANRDAWISAILAIIAGIFFLWLWCFLGRQYPDKTFVETIMQILGKWIGGIVVFSFIFLCLEQGFQMVWYVNDFVTIAALHETPQMIVGVLIVFGGIIALFYGIEAIARASELFVVLISILLMLTYIFVLKDIKIYYLFPILDKGITPVFKGVLYLSSSITLPGIVMMMIYPYHASSLRGAQKPLLMGYLWAGVLYFLSILISTLVLGSAVTARTRYPIFLLAKSINVGGLFSKADFVVATMWIMTLYTKLLLYTYASVLGLAQVLKLKDYRRIVIPLGLVMLIMSTVVFPNTVYQGNWVNTVLTPLFTTFGLLLPLILLVVFYIKKLLKARQCINK